MAKFKKYVVGCGVVVISTVMWAVAACSQLVTKPVANIQPAASSPTSVASPTTQSPNLSEPTPATSSATAETPSAANSMPATSTTTTTTLPPVVNNPPPTTSAPFDTDINDYRLAINGLVNTPLSLSYAEILSYATVTQNAELVCPGEEDVNNQWTGVPVSTILNAAGLMSEAGEVIFTGADGYYIQLPLSSVLNKGVFLAYQVDGQSTHDTRGYPLRLVMNPGPGLQWVEWLTSIRVTPTLASYSNPSPSIQNTRGNVPANSSKTCACLFPVIQGISKT
jgi:DMSO/TMAO reductase YedYZ molybdopterin-dependent catalytic subunit